MLATIDELRAVSPHRWDGAVLGGVALDGMGWDGMVECGVGEG